MFCSIHTDVANRNKTIYGDLTLTKNCVWFLWIQGIENHSLSVCGLYLTRLQKKTVGQFVWDDSKTIGISFCCQQFLKDCGKYMVELGSTKWWLQVDHPMNILCQLPKTPSLRWAEGNIRENYGFKKVLLFCNQIRQFHSEFRLNEFLNPTPPSGCMFHFHKLISKNQLFPPIELLQDAHQTWCIWDHEELEKGGCQPPLLRRILRWCTSWRWGSTSWSQNLLQHGFPYWIAIYCNHSNWPSIYI